jgi:hypothetical protein
MSLVAYVFIFFGVALAVIGIILFLKKDTQGINIIKMFGFEFQLAGSGLVVFVLGVLLMILPIIYSDKLQQIQGEKRSAQKSPEKPTSYYYQPPGNVAIISISLKEYEDIIIKKYEAAKALADIEKENIRLKEKILEYESQLRSLQPGAGCDTKPSGSRSALVTWTLF